jgi:hypothetical protein
MLLLLLLFSIVAIISVSQKVLEPFKMMLPTSGSEPDYNPDLWNSDETLQLHHNCYAYVLDDIVQGRNDKPQPGRVNNAETLFSAEATSKYSSCPVMLDRIKTDNPNIYTVDEEMPCNTGFYKGFLTLAPGKDYHFYRQDSNGYFSHKRGKLQAENVDSDKNKIENPRMAAREYDEYKYDTSCGYFCIPSNTTAPTESI